MDACSKDREIVLYRQFYRQKTSAFAGAGDGPVLRESYSCLSIVNDRQHRGSILPALNALAAKRRKQGVLPGSRDGFALRGGSAVPNSRLRHFQVACNGIALASRLLTND